MNTGLILRPAGAGLESGSVGIEGLRAGCMSVREEDVGWGVGAGGHPVLRIWLHEGKKDPVPLEITSARLDELRQAMECFWPG